MLETAVDAACRFAVNHMRRRKIVLDGVDPLVEFIEERDAAVRMDAGVQGDKNMIKIDDLTIGEARKLAAMFPNGEPASILPAAKKTRKPCPFKKGAAYLIRTVTNYWTGRVTDIVGDFLVLEDAAWIADTGRYSEAVDEAHLKEIEPCAEQVFVALGSVIDARAWATPLPRKVK